MFKFADRRCADRRRTDAVTEGKRLPATPTSWRMAANIIKYLYRAPYAKLRGVAELT